MNEKALPEPRGNGGEQHADVVELRPLIRRVLKARVANPETVEDLVQETLARLIEARPRIRDDGLAAYAVVTARNLATSLGRADERRRDHMHRLVDPRTPPDPEEETMRQEEADAVASALARLSPRERAAVVARELSGKDTAAVARELRSTPGGVSVQLARARAKLRVDYLLALQKTNPPSPVCRQVLVALSAGDRRRQEALDAGGHLLSCAHCAALSEPVLQRRRPLAGLLPVGLLHRLRELVGPRLKSSRAQLTTAAAGTAAATAAAVVLLTNTPDRGPPPPPDKPVIREQGGLTVAGTEVTGRAAPALKPYVGERVGVRRVTIESVPADEGFWIGPARARIFVRLTHRTESGFRARAGQRVTFTGTVVRNGRGFARRMGVTHAEGAAELTRSGRHIVVPQRRVELR